MIGTDKEVELTMSKTPYQLWQKTEVAQCNRKHVLKLLICYSKKQKSFWFTSRFHPIAIRFWDASYLNHGAYESIQWFGIILDGYFFEEESTGILSNAQIDPFKSTQFKVEKKNPKNHKQLQDPPKALPEWKKQP